MKSKKGILLLVGAVSCGMVSLIAALDAFSEVRSVIIITVFAGAFGSGAALVSAIYDFRKPKP